MSLIINHSMAAIDATRSLKNCYAELFTSVRKLASNLKTRNFDDKAVESSALLHADIAALSQGGPGADSAGPLLQTAGGTLAVIGETLVILKNLLLARLGSADSSAKDCSCSKTGMASQNADNAEPASEASSNAASCESAAKAALEALNHTIISRDKSRAGGGIPPKHPEQEASAAQIRADNLAAVEALLSDLHISLEMAESTREELSPQTAEVMFFEGRRSAAARG